jgi:hypothetical protein
VPEALWKPDGEVVPLGPPGDDDVARVLHRALRQAKRDWANEGTAWADDEYEVLQQEAVNNGCRWPTLHLAEAAAWPSPRAFRCTPTLRYTGMKTRAREAVQVPAPTGPRAVAPPKKKTKRRLDWATLHQRTFGTDVLRCPCGGRRTIRALHSNHLSERDLLPTPVPRSPNGRPTARDARCGDRSRLPAFPNTSPQGLGVFLAHDPSATIKITPRHEFIANDEVRPSIYKLITAISPNQRAAKGIAVTHAQASEFAANVEGTAVLWYHKFLRNGPAVAQRNNLPEHCVGVSRHNEGIAGAIVANRSSKSCPATQTNSIGIDIHEFTNAQVP